MSIQSEKNKAIKLIQANKMRDAKLIYKKLSKKVSGDAEVWNTLSAICASLGEYQEAITYCKKAIQLYPEYADAYCNLGAFYEEIGQSDEAMVALQQALALNPGDAEVHFNIANALESKNDLDQAIKHYRSSLAINPHDPDTLVNLGGTLGKQRKFEEAIACYQQVLGLDPGSAEAYNNLGVLFSTIGNMDKAGECFLKAINFDSNFSKPHKNIANVYIKKGLLQKAIKELDIAILIEPDYLDALTSKLFHLNYIEDNQHKLFKEHQAWGNLCLNNRQAQTDWDVTIDTDRKLRIGYVSNDFFKHSVSHFFEPILENHDHNRFEIYCYANVEKPDLFTERLRSICPNWRDVYGLDDHAISNSVIQDKIDILIDLSGHTGSKSPALFALKPAPIQISYLGYPNTIGLPTIDYRITDEWADPEDQDKLHSEKLLRLKTGFLCYRPPVDAPAIAELAATSNDYITFGSFNNISKVTEKVISLWSRILKENNGSRLILKHAALDNSDTKNMILETFSTHGIDSDRLELISWIEDTEGHLALYSKIDIALDPFPYNGTTTSCEALWMGVPVIALRGNRHASRVSYSILHQLSLDELAADTKDSYCQVAQELAANKEQLIQYRTSMRELMQKSPLCNEVNFTKELETQYRKIWQQWCHFENN